MGQLSVRRERQAGKELGRERNLSMMRGMWAARRSAGGALGVGHGRQ